MHSSAATAGRNSQQHGKGLVGLAAGAASSSSVYASGLHETDLGPDAEDEGLDHHGRASALDESVQSSGGASWLKDVSQHSVGSTGSERQLSHQTHAEEASSASLRRMISSLQAQLEDFELRELETQSKHLQQLGLQRSELESKNKTIEELKRQLAGERMKAEHWERQQLSSSLRADSERDKLLEEAAILRLKLSQAQDSLQELQKLSQSGKAMSALHAAEAANRSLTSEVNKLQEELQKRSSELASEKAAAGDVRAQCTEQQRKLQALHEQLSSFIKTEANQQARLEVRQDRRCS